MVHPVAQFPELGFRNQGSFIEAIKAIWEAGSYPAPTSSGRIWSFPPRAIFDCKILSARHGRSDLTAANRMPVFGLSPPSKADDPMDPSKNWRRTRPPVFTPLGRNFVGAVGVFPVGRETSRSEDAGFSKASNPSGGHSPSSYFCEEPLFIHRCAWSDSK